MIAKTLWPTDPIKGSVEEFTALVAGNQNQSRFKSRP